MKPIIKILVRASLLIVVALMLNNYRNNQCIKNQNCQPLFLSQKLSKYKKFPNSVLINYRIIESILDVDITLDKEFSKKYFESIYIDRKDFLSRADEIKKILKNKNYIDSDVIDSNIMIVKKLTIQNTSSNIVDIKPKMLFDPQENINKIKVFNCFCNSNITLKPYESQDLYVYFRAEEGLSTTINFIFKN